MDMRPPPIIPSIVFKIIDESLSRGFHSNTYFSQKLIGVFSGPAFPLSTKSSTVHLSHKPGYFRPVFAWHIFSPTHQAVTYGTWAFPNCVISVYVTSKKVKKPCSEYTQLIRNVDVTEVFTRRLWAKPQTYHNVKTNSTQGKRTWWPGGLVKVAGGYVGYRSLYH